MKPLTVIELKQMLSGMPDNLPVFLARGDWGPSYTHAAFETVLEDSGDDVHNWEVHNPEIPAEEGDRPRIKAVLIR